MSYNIYQWSSFLISFIEIVNIGLILSGISKMNKLGDLNWKQYEKFMDVFEILKVTLREKRKLKISIMFIKIKRKVIPIKYKLLKLIGAIRLKIIKRKSTELEKKYKELVETVETREKIKKEK